MVARPVEVVHPVWVALVLLELRFEGLILAAGSRAMAYLAAVAGDDSSRVQVAHYQPLVDRLDLVVDLPALEEGYPGLLADLWLVEERPGLVEGLPGLTGELPNPADAVACFPLVSRFEQAEKVLWAHPILDLVVVSGLVGAVVPVVETAAVVVGVVADDEVASAVVVGFVELLAAVGVAAVVVASFQVAAVHLVSEPFQGVGADYLAFPILLAPAVSPGLYLVRPTLGLELGPGLEIAKRLV